MRKPKVPCEVIWYTFGRFSGRDGRDDGSESNAPLPARDVEGFRFEVADGRDEIRCFRSLDAVAAIKPWYTFGTARAAKAATISA